MASSPKRPASSTAAKTAASVKESARHTERAAAKVATSADRSTELAADRTVLAAERTYAAWVRTGMAALASGVGARALLAQVLPAWFGALTGSVLIVFSAFCFVAAVWRELTPSVSPRPEVRRIPAALLVPVNAFLVIVDLAALAGVWLAKT